jgi:phenylalanine-4-hydroxylase
MIATSTASPDVVHLDPEHPGFGDPTYRTRRDAIAAVASSYASHGPIPRVEYTAQEHAVWREVRARLAPLHASLVATPVRAICAELPLCEHGIPQLADVSDALMRRTGFRMAPVAGLVAPRAFLSRLGEGEFLSTQYVRHGSRPHYTPEPDIVHELVGHAATLHDPRLARINRSFGAAMVRATAEAARQIERVYWFTLEFGVCEEEGRPRAVGAGLLSSAGELARLSSARPRPWDLEAIASTPYDTGGYQPCLFVAPSYRRMLDDLEAWLAAI